MYNNTEVKKKMNYIKNYWFNILNINIFAYEEFKLNNLSTYRNEVVEIIKVLQTEESPTKYTNGFLFLLKEFNSYLIKNYYFNSEYNSYIKIIKSKIDKIIRSDNNKCFKSDINKLQESLSLKKFNDKNKMLQYLSKIVYENSTLENSINKIKSLVNDLVVELLLSNYSMDFLKKKAYVNSYFDKERLTWIRLPIKEQFQNKIELLFDKQFGKKATVIFRIENLRGILPFKIDNVIFYNPSRNDLLHWKFKKHIKKFEKGLLTIEETNLAKNHTLNDKEWDFHCRVELESADINKAVYIARKKAEKIVTLLRFIYNINHIRVSEEYLLQSGAKNISSLFAFTPRGKYIISYENGLSSEKINMVTSNDSLINKFLTNKKCNEKEDYIKGLRSLHLGDDEKSNLNKYIHYWVSLEYLVGINDQGRSIKTKIINNCSKILTRNYFRVELHTIYLMLQDYFRHTSGTITLSQTSIPNEIKEINGFENFMFSCDGRVLIKNLDKFLKYSKNEYLNYKMKNALELYLNLDERKRFYPKLESNFKQLLSRLYSIRNKIIHTALVDEVELQIYISWLHSILITLCNELLLNIEKGDSIFLRNDIDSCYEKWRKKILVEKEALIT